MRLTTNKTGDRIFVDGDDVTEEFLIIHYSMQLDTLARLLSRLQLQFANDPTGLWIVEQELEPLSKRIENEYRRLLRKRVPPLPGTFKD